MAAREENMARGLYVMQDGSVIVAYGQRRISISRAEYKANGYRPPLEELAAKLPVAISEKVRMARPRVRGSNARKIPDSNISE